MTLTNNVSYAELIHGTLRDITQIKFAYVPKEINDMWHPKASGLLNMMMQEIDKVEGDPEEQQKICSEYLLNLQGGYTQFLEELFFERDYKLPEDKELYLHTILFDLYPQEIRKWQIRADRIFLKRRS